MDHQGIRLRPVWHVVSADSDLNRARGGGRHINAFHVVEPIGTCPSIGIMGNTVRRDDRQIQIIDQLAAAGRLAG